jgi:NAD(P)H-dependent FMN reductase
MANSPLKIGVIVCSQRSPRIGDQVGKFVFDTLKSNQAKEQSTNYELSLIDLAEKPLPFFDEPIIPQMIHDPKDYHHEHTRIWSRLVNSHSAFVFVTPQYNWSFPANLKNAIDFLFNEWGGKPAMIVSYGGHGGDQSATQLKHVLGAIKMKVADRSVGLAFPKQGEDGRGFTKKAFGGKDLGLGGDEGVWTKEMKDVKTLFAEMLGKLDMVGEEGGPAPQP